MSRLCAILTALTISTAAWAEEMKDGGHDVIPQFRAWPRCCCRKSKKDTGIVVQLLVVGTGQALRLGKAGDVDAILVHAKPAEESVCGGGQCDSPDRDHV